MSMLPEFVDLEEFDEPLEHDPFVSKKKIKKKYVNDRNYKILL